MSRLLVKNLPAYLTQSRLREHFESKDGPGGTLTDVKVLLKRDGTSRRFGFVGYKTEVEAEKARKWFDRTFIDASRINVTVVDGAKDAPAPRPNKRPRLDPSSSVSGNLEKVKSSKRDKADASAIASSSKNKQLEEYLKVMQPKKGPAWANDETIATPSASASSKGKAKAIPNQDVAVQDALQSDDEFKTEGVSDMDWLQRHTKSALDEPAVEKLFEQSDDEGEAQNESRGTDDRERPPDDSNKAIILETSRLFLRNLSFMCTQDELVELFKPYGTVAQVHIPVDPDTKSSKGMAYVTFAKPEDAVSAYEALDKKSFQGRLLHILPAVNRKGKVEIEDVGKKRNLKEDREAKRKTMAGKEFNWSMLYMNSDAVVSSIADRMNVSKADILNPESDNAAVKLALAETHVIQETKSFLEQNGVNLSAFSAEKRVPRSDGIILVKNIPYGTTAEQIRELFEPHGELRRVLVPPTGTMAIVEFIQLDEGRKAFRAIAYRRLGNSIIYLEKGPEGMFTPLQATPKEPVTATAIKPVTIEDQEAAAQTEEPSVSAGTTLFVKNLSFSTTSERLTQVFRNLPSFAFARVQTKPDPKRPGGKLSMGYGFVGFKDADAARKALKSMQGYALDGHALVVKFAGRGAEEDQAGEGKPKSKTTKMLVKNVPFEATKKDIRELFGSHGQLKSVRLPKRFDHRSRGFAFLEFLTRHEAENAYAALRHTHLLGRHLVLEWAEEGEQDIDELRKKAGVGFGDGKELPGRKRKLQLGDGEVDGDEM